MHNATAEVWHHHKRLTPEEGYSTSAKAKLTRAVDHAMTEATSSEDLPSGP